MRIIMQGCHQKETQETLVSCATVMFIADLQSLLSFKVIAFEFWASCSTLLKCSHAILYSMSQWKCEWLVKRRRF